MYDKNEDVLVARKSDYQKKISAMDISLSLKKSGFVKMMGSKGFISSSSW